MAKGKKAEDSAPDGIRKIVPVQGLIVVRPEITKGPRVSDGGVVLPEETEQFTNRGKVLAVSEGRHTINGDLIKPCVSEGDRVLFQPASHTQVKLEDGDIVVVMHETQVMATLG